MPVYSHSKLSMYETCPRQYKLWYIDRIRPHEGEEGIEAYLGNRVHETLEKLYRELLLTKMNTLEDLLEYYKRQWEKNWHDNVVILKKEFTRDHYFSTGLLAISNYYGRHYPFNQSKTLATERLIVFKIGDYTIQGYIDRLSHDGKGRYEIHDYKTSAHLPTQDKLDRDRQLALYQIGIRAHFRDATDVVLKWHYLIHGKEFTSTRSDSQLRELEKEVVSLISTIERDTVFPPVESSACDWCEVDLYCPAKKHVIEVQSLPPEQYLKEDGVVLVNRYASVKAKIDKLKEEQKQLELELDRITEAVVEYARNHAVSVITGSEYALKITEGTCYQFPRANEEGRAELERFLKEHGLWDRLATLNVRRLENVVESDELNETTRKRLLRFAEEVETVNVRLVKKRQEE